MGKVYEYSKSGLVEYKNPQILPYLFLYSIWKSCMDYEYNCLFLGYVLLGNSLLRMRIFNSNVYRNGA